MPAINLPTGLRGDSDTPKQKEVLINCFFQKGDVGTIAPRPGISPYLSVFGGCRGSGSFNGSLYQVSSNRLIRIDEDNFGNTSYTDITGPNIDGNQDCLLIESFTKLLIMVKGGKAYVYDGITLAEITDPLYETSIDATFLFSRFVFVPEDGGPYFWSDLNNPASIQPDSFADAEVLPDKNFAVEELKDSLIIFGGATIERHSFNSSLNTFQRQQGATQNIGYVGGKARYNQTLVFIGRPINGTFSIYLYGQDTPISNKSVDEVLNQYSLDQLRDVRADFFSWKGQAMIKWRLPNEDLLYYGDFAFVKSGISNNELGHWNADFIQSFKGKLICGDRNNARAGELLDINTDYGLDIESIVQTYVREAPRTNFKLSNIYLSATTGQSNDERKIELSVSEDGVGFGPTESIDSGPLGQFNNELSWGPIGSFDNFAAIKFRWVGDIKLPIDGATVD